METSRRRVVLGSAAGLALAGLGAPRIASAQTTTLKISHQFPGGTLTEGDFRDRLCRKFAADVTAKTNGALKFEIYPGSSLVKVNSQFAALRKGALDMSLVPLSYAGGEVPETNIGLMPGARDVVRPGLQVEERRGRQDAATFLADKGIVVVTWIWQAGGVASRVKPLVAPEDAKGMKVRGGSREMDMILKEAGASVLNLPSNEIYAAMQTGAMDAGMTSSTSLISFRLEEVAKALTTGRKYAYWFMFEPLLMSKEIFDKLPKDQQAAIMSVGADLEKFALDAAKADDQAVSGVYAEGRREGGRPGRADRQEVAGHRARHRVEGLRREDGHVGEAARRPRRRRCEPRRRLGATASHGAMLAGPVPQALVPLARAACPHQPRRRLSLSMIALVLAAAVLTYSVVLAVPVQGGDRLAGRDRGVPARRRDVHVRRLRAVVPRPRRHRGDGERPPAAR